MCHQNAAGPPPFAAVGVSVDAKGGREGTVYRGAYPVAIWGKTRSAHILKSGRAPSIGAISDRSAFLFDSVKRCRCRRVPAGTSGPAEKFRSVAPSCPKVRNAIALRRNAIALERRIGPWPKAVNLMKVSRFPLEAANKLQKGSKAASRRTQALAPSGGDTRQSQL